jgi:hypothetical protein
MSVLATFGPKHSRDEDTCDQYHDVNLRVKQPDALFNEYSDWETFDGPSGTYGGVVFNARGHAVKFTPIKNGADEEPYNTCLANKKGHAPEFYDAWKVKDADDEEFYAIEMETYDDTLYDYIITKPTKESDDSDIDSSLADLITQLAHDRTCHSDLHLGNIMLKRTADGHYTVKAIDWMGAKFEEKVCKSPLFFYEELEELIGVEDMKLRFSRTRQAVLDFERVQKAAARALKKNNG